MNILTVEDDIMDRKPREKDEGFFANGLMVKVIWQGVMVGLLTLVSYSIGQYFSNHEYDDDCKDQLITMELVYCHCVCGNSGKVSCQDRCRYCNDQAVRHTTE